MTIGIDKSWNAFLIARAIALTGSLLVSACCGFTEDSSSGAIANGAEGAQASEGVATTVDFYRPTEPLVIEESDLVKANGSWLYVLNEHTGLHVIDTSEPRSPERRASLATLAGVHGELYVREKGLLVLVGDSALECHSLAPEGLELYPSTGIASVTEPTTAPEVASERCVPGELVASRLVGDILYVVTTAAPIDPGRGWLFSLDVSSGDVVKVLADLPLDGAGFEIHMTSEAVYVAEETASNTRVRYIDISAGDGTLSERDQIEVPGKLPGRFHMSAYGSSFRIVTRGLSNDASSLSVIDVTEPDHLELIGSINDLAPGEELFATRFVGDRAYVVTYQPEIIVNEVVEVVGRDPLWVISLEDPSAPEILGRLEIPGWSDYIFPRGKLLLAVGRGDAGSQVATSLFDVSDPAEPVELRRLQFGSATASSEVSSDFRAVQLVEGELDGWPLVVVPYSDNVDTGEGCVPEHHIQFIEIADAELQLRGNVEQSGRVLRTLPVREQLYAVTTKAVTAYDISDRDVPRALARIPVGNESLLDECVLPPEAPQRIVTMTRTELGNWNGAEGRSAEFGPCGCSVSAGPSRCLRGQIWGALLAVAACGVGARVMRPRRRRRGRASSTLSA